ncbi:hypothetical protein AWB74_02133 [Caballeronia arvi]|uniref:Uncharacterized protein n=1 Tax=Caballeronia arvi TaxID=1777135 RepID=A0A158HUS1_9BURK|nr:hypothetical protein [Caballeronia arvi]SAL47450.1 hypothetical protein AWB74_02133 [Caballeronia arvi]
MGIKVIATAQGYHGQFREVGDEFEVENEEAFSDKWMEKLDGKRTKRIAGSQAQTTGNNPIGGASRDVTSDLV